MRDQYTRLKDHLRSHDWFYQYGQGQSYITGRASYHDLERLLNRCWRDDEKQTARIVGDFFEERSENLDFASHAAPVLAKFMEVR